MSYRITQPSGSELEPALIRLWTDNLQMRSEPRNKFLWYYRGNPLGAATAFVLESCKDTGCEIVGSCGIGPRIFYVLGEQVSAGLLADFTVDKAHRSVLPALMLQRAISEHAKSTYNFAYAYPNGSAVGVFTRIGYQELGRSARYVRVLRTAPFVRRLIPFPVLQRPAAFLGDTAVRIRDVGKALRIRRVQTEWTTCIDERFDRLFERVRSRFDVIGDRRASFLRWRFMERLGVQARCLTLVDSSGELAAYAIITDKEEGTALLADFLGLTQHHLGTLLECLAGALRSQGYSSLLTYFLGAPEIAAVLGRHGFRFRNPGKHVVFSSSAPSAAQQTALSTQAGWFLTEADRDN